MFPNIVTYLLILTGCNGIEVNENVVNDLMRRLDQLATKVDSNELILHAQKAQLEDLKTVRKALANEPTDISVSERRFVMDSDGPIAFTAAIGWRAQGYVHVNSGVVFETELANYGGGYNKHTGIFVVSIAGIYLFSSSIVDHMQSHYGFTNLHAEIVRNNATLARVYAHATTTYRDQGAQTVIVKVDVGDQVWVRLIDNDLIGISGELYTTFSGYMLWTM